MDSHASFLSFPALTSDWNSNEEGEEELTKESKNGYFCKETKRRPDPEVVNLSLEEDYKPSELYTVVNLQSSELR